MVILNENLTLVKRKKITSSFDKRTVFVFTDGFSPSININAGIDRMLQKPSEIAVFGGLPDNWIPPAYFSDRECNVVFDVPIH